MGLVKVIVLEVACEDARVKVRSNYTTLDDPVTLFVAGNKSVVHRRLAEHGLPTPDYAEFTLPRIGTAVKFLEQTEQACVVKPAAGTGAGQGITTGIRRPTQLARAAALAARFHRDLIIERQIAGENYRLLYLDGVLIDAVRRHPPTLIGDGKSTIRSLLHEENRRRLAGWKTAQALLRIDSDMKQTLFDQHLSLRCVPAAGLRVQLKTVVNDNAARDNEPVVGQQCPEIISCGRLAGEVLGVRLAGVDVITTDATRSLRDTCGVILEVNTTPGLYHHKRGDSCFVATLILDAMLKERQHATTADGPC